MYLFSSDKNAKKVSAEESSYWIFTVKKEIESYLVPLLI